MDQSNRLLLWLIGVLVVCVGLSAAVSAVLERRQSTIEVQPLRNLSMAAAIEIRDASSRRVMRGEFQELVTQTADRRRAAQLLSDDESSVGKAEVEVTRLANGVLVQELEVDVDGLARNATYSVLVDGVVTGVFRTNPFGGAELERYGRVPELSARAH